MAEREQPEHDEEREESASRPDEPIELEPAEAEPEPVINLRSTADTCPECGATIPSGETICLRCGFDPRGEAHAEQAKPEPAPAPRESDELAANDVPTGPLSVPGRGDIWPPLIIGSIGLAVLFIAHVVAAPGLFPQVLRDEAAALPDWTVRANELLRTIVLLLFWTSCGLAGLFATSIMLERQLGDAKLAAFRIAAMVAGPRLFTLLAIPGPRWVEWMAEAILQAGGFILLGALLFGLALRNAALLAAWTLLAILTLWIFSFAVQWAMTSGSLV